MEGISEIFKAVHGFLPKLHQYGENQLSACADKREDRVGNYIVIYNTGFTKISNDICH